ncbi:pullulanase [Thermococcus sp. EP1]|uniref:alpha-amylase family glycosyl hydrolase n=1 Tax=Thermococcus sp. EP1 TaxID=1591054 RepID=UPI0006DA6E3C|nr:alpha-amylase family glycosyl hydrolase [Thermococcus sp. EP1]KPU62585.1 pullulanase [Thermococcus sp. EP1]
MEKRYLSLIFILLILSVTFAGCITQTNTKTETLVIPEGNYTTIYLNEKGTSQCPASKVPVTFTYTPPKNESIDSVSLRGSFNDWAEWPMQKENGAWSITVCLEPGRYEYKFFINGEWVKDMSSDKYGNPVDPEADEYVDDGFGGKNAVRIVEGNMGFVLEHNPRDPAYLCVADNRTVVRFKTRPGQVQSAVLVTNLGEYNMSLQLWWGSGEMWRVELPFVEPIEYYIKLTTPDNEEFLVLNTSTDAFFSFDGNNSFPQVEWVSKGVGYQIFPERFNNGDPSNDALALQTDEFWFNELIEDRPILSNWSDPITPLHCCHQYFGGDIRGIIEKLDYLQELGVTFIYLNPIFLAGSAHGYDIYDYYRVDPQFGTDEDLKLLLEEAHKRGIRVIFDFVPNHSGIGHWAFLDVASRGKESPYWNWYFVQKWPFKLGDGKAYIGWWGIGSLPKLNTMNPEVKEYLIGAALYWLDFGFDGIRVDVPNELINADEFFSELRQRVKEKHPEAYIVGEIWQLSPKWVQGDKFDSLMNYALGRDILLNYALGTWNGERTLELLGRYFASYGENVAAMGFNLISSHDTSRLLTDLGGGRFGENPKPEAIERLKMLSTLLYSLPGAPVTFQGDERGILGEKEYYDAHRYPIQWDKVNEEVLTHYKGLGMLRKRIPALTSSAIKLYTAKDGVIAFFRGHENEVLVLANNGKTSTSIALPPGKWKLVWPAEEGIFEGEIEVPPVMTLVLERE